MERAFLITPSPSKGFYLFLLAAFGTGYNRGVIKSFTNASTAGLPWCWIPSSSVAPRTMTEVKERRIQVDEKNEKYMEIFRIL